MVNAIAGIFGSLGGQWLKNRGEKSAAKHTATLAKITHKSNWETEQAKGGQNSWKDEFVTVYMAMPYGIIFVAALFDQEEIIVRMERAFEAMKHTPDWFHYTFVAVILAAVGIRATKEYFGRNKD